MNIQTTPDIYTPSIDDQGNYIDHIPVIRNGIRCSCGATQNKIYDNSTKFSSHTKTQRHKKWLSILNQNKSNYYVENIKHVELIDNQKLIISRLEKQLQTKNLTIDILTEELSNLKLKNNNHTNTYLDLLDIN